MAMSPTMQTWWIVPGQSRGLLELHEEELPVPGEGEVLVALRAAALNRRDVYLLDEAGQANGDSPFIPLSDGAGDVTAIGPNVTRWRQGDRVITTFFPLWIEGPSTMEQLLQRGERGAPGVLRSYMAVHESELVRLPEELTYQEGATLPCAGGTAWNALAGLVDSTSRETARSTVLILGTGGVALFGAQIAKAAGARVIVVSRSEEKLQRLRRLSLPVDAMIASDEGGRWEDRVLELTGRVGVDYILEVAGRETLAHSLAAAALNGHIALIGEVSGLADGLDILPIRSKLLTVRGMSATNRDKLEDLTRFIVRHAIHPVVDRVFAFPNAPKAFDYVRGAEHIGKVVIDL
jgi:NADPH:quinone reductase-like Zn-dependent oxidoreductase